jgi:metal-responsive CopG/Arc/MetJ family transcriptional regulator
MKVKTSVTLSEDVLREIDHRAAGNRSEWIERVVRSHLQKLDRAEKDASDAATFARLARIGAAESDVLDYTVPIRFEEPHASG